MLSNTNWGDWDCGVENIVQRLAGHQFSCWSRWMNLHCFILMGFFPSSSICFLNDVFLTPGVPSIFKFFFSPPSLEGSEVNKGWVVLIFYLVSAHLYPSIHRPYFRESWNLAVRLDEQLSDRGGIILFSLNFIGMICVFII